MVVQGTHSGDLDHAESADHMYAAANTTTGNLDATRTTERGEAVDVLKDGAQAMEGAH